MRFLVDNAVSPLVAEALRQEGYEALHVRDLGIQTAEDSEILYRAAVEDRVVVSADTDFGALLALRQQRRPSVVLFRGDSTHDPRRQTSLLLANLPALEADLVAGCIVVFEAARIRIRLLPVGG